MRVCPFVLLELERILCEESLLYMTQYPLLSTS